MMHDAGKHISASAKGSFVRRNQRRIERQEKIGDDSKDLHAGEERCALRKTPHRFSRTTATSVKHSVSKVAQMLVFPVLPLLRYTGDATLR